MNLGDYVAEIHGFLQSHPHIASYRLETDVRGESFLYLTGTVHFLSGTTLDFKEFLEFQQDGLERYKYAYNYRDGTRVIFRYDNAPDPRARHLSTYPAHKHEGETLIASPPVDIWFIITEIHRNLPD